MPYFKKGESGSLSELGPGERVILKPGDGKEGQAIFAVGNDPLFNDTGRVEVKGSRFRVTLQKTRQKTREDLPLDGDEHDVGRRGVTVFDRSTGKPVLEVVHARDY